MRAAVAKFSLPAGAALAVASAALALVAPGASGAMLGLALAAAMVGASLQLQRILAALRTEATARRTAFERARDLSAQTSSIATSLQSMRDRLEQVATEDSCSSIARNADIDALIAADQSSALLLVGGAPVELRGRAIHHVYLGHGTLSAFAPGDHSHVLLDTVHLQRADEEERLWLQRLFRWQGDTILAAPVTDESLVRSALLDTISAPVSVERRGRLLLLQLLDPPAASLGAR